MIGPSSGGFSGRALLLDAGMGIVSSGDLSACSTGSALLASIPPAAAAALLDQRVGRWLLARMMPDDRERSRQAPRDLPLTVLSAVRRARRRDASCSAERR